ncbi:interferon alpha-inducible protein 27, mitochondrial-like [Tachypleus tridentatus]|uniref:interferon alpha-inducible protein 27, mitochondrial-like n=1 Tax=Tachypleus tridentatus TaxID=6853 RepID=UPI003FCF7743
MKCHEAAHLLAKIILGVGVGSTTVLSIPLILSALGFSTVGVTAGSAAALFQSVFYGGSIASGSLFSFLQSIGAAGISLLSSLGIGCGAGGLSTFLAKHTVNSLTELLIRKFCPPECVDLR